MAEASTGRLPSLLVLRHETFEHLGHFAATLEQEGIACVYSDLGEAPDLAGHEGLIIMGGPQSANDAALLPELRFIERALHSQIPMLGICLGAQLIAKALGAQVHRNREKEIGWAPVYFTEAAASDALFSGLPSPTTFFHWHGETFTLPKEAVRLAYSGKCAQQAFRYGESVYGIQFHPEITAAMVLDWCAQPANCGDLDTLDQPPDAGGSDTAPLARRIIKGWLQTAQRANGIF